MGKATEVVTPPTPVVAEEQPNPVQDAPKPSTLISLEQLEHLDAAGSTTERVERLESALGVQHYPVNPRTSVWVDFCFGVLNFARDDARLPPDKALGLLTLAHEVYVFATQPLQHAADSPVSKLAEPVPPNESMDPQEQAETKVKRPTPAWSASPDAYPTVEAVYDQFREKIRHASGVGATNDNDQEVPSWPAAPFSPTEVARIVAFFTSTFFRHLRAYQYLSRVPRPSVVRETPVPTETPLPPRALVDATLQAE
ncbi:hypothetical protein PHYSODRAFT_305463 [Phytophthora sojae]|uniref:Uncharacterized protein n=1 Tax=Phytophthora sojae (strain P6497) TaxID=1094619 RepID=G5A3R5_PHYSP|nr:hypothetical protein PHYSODRAFT_305463 [Phytophthora sojae]EGZ10229.1 hypothetical protein PHYSODRAFT_305463 [Phytophthora sojae]|eukprot:XP_009535090.1 hypothetical protein PHYSODRAFT_305463 [Phytophthora sojae]